MRNDWRVTTRNATPRGGGDSWDDSDRSVHVILSDRVREGVEESPDGARVDPTFCGRSWSERSPDPEEILRLGQEPSLRMTRLCVFGSGNVRFTGPGRTDRRVSP
jgi:hypothetical protein